MRLIGLMLVRNEEWCIEASLRVALMWCDVVVVSMDRCLDSTRMMVHDVRVETKVETEYRVHELFPSPWNVWNEMDLRHGTLEYGRQIHGTHFAIIDGDELLTANLFVRTRHWFEDLKPGEVLELPRIAPVSLDSYWTDNHEHACGGITLGFCDRPDLAWRPRGSEQYHFHARPPAGSGPVMEPLGRERSQGGVMHLQYANRNRMRAKSLWYMLNERVRWPNRKTPQELNAIYGDMLAVPRETKPIPDEWWTEEKQYIHLDEAESWHLEECRQMVKEYGREILTGLNTRGFKI